MRTKVWTSGQGFATTASMNRLSDPHFEQAKLASEELNAAMKPLKMLSSLAWPDEFCDRFITHGKLPAPIYYPIDIQPSLDLVKQARARVQGDHVVLAWLRRQADTAETMAHMLAARGTKAFSEQSQILFGQPTKLMHDKSTRVIDLARHMDETLADLDIPKLVVDGYETFMDAEAFAATLRPLLTEHFGDAAPNVVVATDLASKAAASSSRIRVRANARFSRRDIDQLLQHEALIHVATAHNGRAQDNFPVLGRAHAGTTEIQEGLAVFAEMISGAMDPKRFRRLADRVIAIQMTMDGADFVEVYKYYAERTASKPEAYENTRRMFRGGLLTGGAPFTKDMVYLNGLLRVHNFMRSVVKLGRADLIRLLFVGKLDLEDVPALAQLAASGRIAAPKFMPPWAKDLRFLVSYLAYSSFLNQVKLPGLQRYYEDALAEVPVIWDLTD